MLLALPCYESSTETVQISSGLRKRGVVQYRCSAHLCVRKHINLEIILSFIWVILGEIKNQTLTLSLMLTKLQMPVTSKPLNVMLDYLSKTPLIHYHKDDSSGMATVIPIFHCLLNLRPQTKFRYNYTKL